MLGHIAFDYLKSTGKYNVFGTSRNDLDVEKMNETEIENTIGKYKPDIIINCIGLIRNYSNENENLSYKINGQFPHLLSYLGIKNNWKIIHISTDCVYDNDVYGQSKYLGEINDIHNVTVRTSIIGPELRDGTGLFHWFMSQTAEIQGYKKVIWDGVTTLELSLFIEKIIENPELFKGIINYRTKQSISKYDLLIIISNQFDKKIKINQNDKITGDKTNRDSEFFSAKDYVEQLTELRNYMINKEEYKKYFTK